MGVCAENHRWWWYSFVCSGSTAIYLFAYSCVWFKQLEASKMLITYMLYFGYMFLISGAVFLVTGMVEPCAVSGLFVKSFLRSRLIDLKYIHILCTHLIPSSL